MSNALELVVSTIQKFLLEASPSDADSLPGSYSHLFLLIFSQLQRTHRLLEDFSKELVLDWHGLIYEELNRVVTRISTLVRYPGDISIPAEARGEHFLETLLDVRWWTWVIALQVGTLLTDPTLYNVYFGTFEGVLEVKVSSLPFGGDSVSRRLPSYSFELWQQGTKGRLREILQSKSGGNRLRDEGQNEADMLLTDVRNINAELPDFKIKQLGTTKFRDAGKPSSIGDYLPIDLTQDLLGVSTTGYVIRTTCSNGHGGLFSCALKRINTRDDKPPDLARLWHPHVVHLIHHWREKSGLHCGDRERMPNFPFMTFLVMELMDGDLAKLMTRTQKAGVSPFSLLVAVDIMLQIAKGMLYLHEMGVSHPHLKCDNVLCRAENKTHPAFQVGDVHVKLGGFGCSRTATVDTKNRDVFCFGLTCLEILTGDDWSEDIYGADRVLKPIIPEMTPPILKHCISSCLSINLSFSEVLMLLLLAQCQIMQTCNDEMMLCTESLHTNKEETNIQDVASSSTSGGTGLNEVFHVHQLHPQLGEVSTSVQITLIFFHGFPKVSEEWRMTWMTRDNKLVWPQKWLPEDLGGNIRVLSVSYDDHLNVSSNQTIENLLQILILSGTWKLGGIEQAIILVGHSFGGVIIKSLVTEAQKLAQKTVVNSVDFEEVMKCTKFLMRLASIVFYSVPHSLTNTEFENYISGCSNTRVLQRSSLLKSLRKDDDFIPKMIQLSRDFESAVPHKTKVLVFLEGKPMSKKCFLVSENSREGQSLSWEWHKDDKDNHFEVCRPDSKSHTGYKILLNHLLKLCVTFTYDCTSPTINRESTAFTGADTSCVLIDEFPFVPNQKPTLETRISPPKDLTNPFSGRFAKDNVEPTDSPRPGDYRKDLPSPNMTTSVEDMSRKINTPAVPKKEIASYPSERTTSDTPHYDFSEDVYGASGAPGTGGPLGATAAAPLPALEWTFSQVFGERAVGEEVQEVDIISAIEFDKTGEHLATGDRGGRVVLFERMDGRDQRTRRVLERTDLVGPRHPEYRYSTEFQSHEPEFDYLKSLEIEEKINKIRWCQTANAAQFLLSTNDKTIKLWKVTEKKIKQVKNLNVDPGARGNGNLMTNSMGLNLKSFAPRMSMNEVAVNRSKHDISPDFVFPPGGIPALHLPSVWSNETVLVTRCRRVYANAHAYHINTISSNSDCETYISADDLRINLWNLEVSDQSFNIVDIKPTNMEDITEVITSAEFHPTQCNMLAYSCSNGSIRLIDMRQSALCDRHSKLFQETEPPGARSFLTDISASISDIKFARGGRYILSRDYMTLKLWDVNMESAPVATFKVHEHLRPKLCDLYENDSIFDKFECCLSGDGTRIATGSYSNLFRVFGATTGSEESSTLEASKTPNRRLITPPPKPGSRLANLARGRRDNRRGSESPGAEFYGGVHDFTSKLLHLAWHPTANVIACAASNSLYMYYA